MLQDDRLPPGRYGARRGRPRSRRAVAGVALLGAAFLGWVVWAGLGAAAPTTRGQVTGFRVVSAGAIEVRVAAATGSSGRFACTVRALDETREVVGVGGVTLDAESPRERTERVTLRTRERAVTATVGACQPA